MAHMISMGGDTQTAIANGDIIKLKELLVAERDSVKDILVELLDPAAFHQKQGIVQALDAVISILPQ